MRKGFVGTLVIKRKQGKCGPSLEGNERHGCVGFGEKLGTL